MVDYIFLFAFAQYLEPEKPPGHHLHAGHLAARLQRQLLLLHPLLLLQAGLRPASREENIG